VPDLGTVLLVDDDSGANFLHKAILQRVGSFKDIVEYTDAEEALSYLSQSVQDNSAPDLILLDINMPLLDGWEFMERYNQLSLNGQKSTILMLTSSIDPSDIRRAQKIPNLDGFRSKPLTFDMMHEILETYFS
jgi:CheY-like chemotaxis protein